MANASIAPSSMCSDFSIVDLQRIWRRDSPTEHWPSQTRLLIRRASPDDVGSGGIEVCIDDHPVQARLRHGESVTVDISAGAHLVTITNGWVARQLRAEVQRGHALIVDCGIGLQSRLWSALLPRRLLALNVWVAARPGTQC